MADFEMTLDNREKILEAKDAAVKRVLEMIGLQMETHAKNNVTEAIPRAGKVTDYVSTGRLRNSISHAHDDTSVEVGTNVEYAIYNEYGTAKMSAVHMLRNAVADHIDEYQNMIENELRNA